MVDDPDAPRRSARDFLYGPSNSEDAPPSYQLEHQGELWRDGVEPLPEDWKSATDASNDPLLAVLRDRLIALAPVDVREPLGLVFIQKRRDWEANAYAPTKSLDVFTGYWIEFNVGFSDATLQFATFFERVTGEHASPVPALREAMRMAYVTELWRATGELFIGDLGYRQEDVTAKSVALSVLGDLWAVAHEMSHHLLGHTSQHDLASHHLANLGPSLSNKFSCPTGLEYQADALASLLLMGGAAEQPPSQANFEAAFGAHLALTVTYLGDPDPVAGSESHPSPVERIAALNELLERLFPGSGVIQQLAADFTAVRALIERTIEMVPDPPIDDPT